MEGKNVKLLENLAALIKVKTLVTMCVMAVWAYLALSGVIETTAVTELTLMVVSFYFGTVSEKRCE